MMDNWPYTVKFTGKPGKSSTVEMGGGTDHKLLSVDINTR